MQLISIACFAAAAGLAVAAPAAAASATPSLTASSSLTCTNAKTAKFNCPVKGLLSKPNVIGKETGIATLNACRDVCLSNKPCISFFYNKTGGQCIQYGKDLPHQGLKKDNTQAGQYYNRACFTCSTASLTTSTPTATASSTTTTAPASTSTYPASTSTYPASTSTSPASTSTAPATCGNEGLEYAIYSNDQGDNVDSTYSNFDPSHFQTQTPESTSTTTTIGGFDGNTNPMTIYGGSYSFPSTYFVVNHRGYIYAPVAGTYTVNTGINGSAIDDSVFFYTGSSALSGYTRDNALVDATFNTGYGITTTTFNADAGYLPFRVLFAQAQQNAGLTLEIYDPNNNRILATNFDTTDLGDFVVQQGCGDATTPNAFPAWGSEGAAQVQED